MKFKLLHALGLITAFVMPLPAATLYWDGGATTGNGLSENATTTGLNWLSGGNWDNGTTSAARATWTAGDSAIFGGTATTQTITAGTLTIGDMTFGQGGTGTGTSGTSYTISGGAITLSATSTVTTNTNATINTVMSGTGALVKEGAGMLTLGSVANTTNTYSGGTTVNAGTLALGTNSSSGNGVIRGALTIGSGGTVSASTSWSLGYGSGVSVSSIAINGGTLNFTGALDNGGTTASSITMTGGTISGTGFDWYNGSAVTRTLTTLASSTTATISSGINMRLGNGTLNSGALKFDVADGVADVDLLVSGVLRYNTGQAGATVIKDGAGRAVFSAANTYTSATTVTNGSLLLNAGSLHTSSAVAVASIATFGGKGSAGAVSVTGGTIQGGYADVGNLSLTSLSFAGSSALSLMPALGSTASVAVSGALTTSGTQTLNIISSNPLGVGSYRLVSWGSIAGSGTGAFVLGSTPATPGTVRPRSYALDTTPANYVGLNVTGDAPVWTGNTNGGWDTTTTNNWVLASDGTTPTTYYSADAVQFNNTTGTRNITISGSDVTPASVAFNNGTGNDYTLGGSNGIAGSSSLTKSGAGALTINNTNTYTGSTTINAGTLEIGGSGTLGNGNYAGAINNNAAFIYSSSADQTFSGAISGTGSLTKSGAATLTLSGSNYYSGATTISGGTVSVGATGLSSGSALTLSGGSTLNLTSGVTLANNITIASGQTGTLKQSGAFSSVLTGNYSGVSGTLTLDVSGGNNTGISPNSANGPALGSVVNIIGAGGANQVYCNPNGDAAQTFFANAKVSVTATGPGATHFFLGNLNNNRNVQFGALDGGNATTLIDSDNRQTTLTVNGVADGNFAGVIANGSGGTITFVKTGSATQTLSGANTYTGTTTIKNGSLVLSGGNDRLATTGSVTVGDATTSGKLVLGNTTAASNQTLAVLTTNGLGGSVVGAHATNDSLLTLNIASGTNTFGGTLGGTGNHENKLALTKSGAGTLELTGTNTYTGLTTVSLGKLVVGVFGGGSITSNVTVASGATLGGSGTITGNVTLNGGTLAAGNSSGTLTVTGDTSFNSGSIFEWDLNAATADPGASTANSGSYDHLNVSGNLGGSAAVFKVVLGSNAFTDAFWDTDKSWNNIFTAATSSDLGSIFTTFSGAGGIAPNGVVAGQGGFTLSGSTLSWTAVPEPSSAAACLLLGAGLLRRRRN